MSGKHSAEGTLFQILSLIVTEFHDLLFVPIEFSFDKTGRVAHLVAKGVLETDVEPIKNPVIGAPHRIQIIMPEGFEHREAEVASANIRSEVRSSLQRKARTLRWRPSCIRPKASWARPPALKAMY